MCENTLGVIQRLEYGRGWEGEAASLGLLRTTNRLV